MLPSFKDVDVQPCLSTIAPRRINRSIDMIMFTDSDIDHPACIGAPLSLASKNFGAKEVT